MRAGYLRDTHDARNTGHAADASADHATTTTSTTGGGEVKLPQRQPAALGKIQEIDLGPDAALRNVARTEAATRRILGVTPDVEFEDKPPEKVRLGRDGKPRRRRNRRGSDDIKRDEIVEAVLRESKLDLYDAPSPPDAAPNSTDDQAADDVIAEQFRREFLEAVQSRNHVRQRAATSQGGAGAGKGGKVDDKPRGPKLGGSRSARAAMHAQEKAKKR